MRSDFLLLNLSDLALPELKGLSNVVSALLLIVDVLEVGIRRNTKEIVHGADGSNLELVKGLQVLGGLSLGAEVALDTRLPDIRELSGSISTRSSTSEEVVEGSSPGITKGQRLVQIEHAAEGVDEGRVLKLGVGEGTMTLRIVNDSVVDPRRDEEGGNTETETIKVEVNRLRAGKAIRVGDVHRRSNVVIETSMLVISEDKGRLEPRARVAQVFINFLVQGLTEGDGVIRMLIVGRDALGGKEAREHEGEGGKSAILRVLSKSGVGTHARRKLGLTRVVEEERILSLVEIEGPIVTSLIKLLIDRVSVETVLRNAIPAVALGGGRVPVHAVSVGGTRNRRMPLIEENELLRQSRDHGNFRGIPTLHNTVRSFVSKLNKSEHNRC